MIGCVYTIVKIRQGVLFQCPNSCLCAAFLGESQGRCMLSPPTRLCLYPCTATLARRFCHVHTNQDCRMAAAGTAEEVTAPLYLLVDTDCLRPAVFSTEPNNEHDSAQNNIWARRLTQVEFIDLQGFKAGGDGWFREVCSLWPGQGMSLKVKEVLFQQRSKFQVRFP